MRPKLLLFALCLLFLAGMPLIAFAQAPGQRDLLERAYDTKSYDLLEQFFDNRQKEYADNEVEAPDKWIAEAHKVFAAMVRPEISSQIGIEVYGHVLVVQGSLEKIGCVKRKTKDFLIGNLDGIIYTIVDSAVDFRPKYQLENITTVYLSDNYRTIVNDYFSTFNPPALIDYNTFDNWEITETDSIWTVTDNNNEPYDEFTAKIQAYIERSSFLRDFTGPIYCPHMFGPTTIVPFFTIDKIVFDLSLRHAVVFYSQCISGGIVVLKKVKNRWTFDFQYEYWIE